MIKFGASTLSWISSWSPEKGLYAIQKTAENGFDILEMSLPASLEFDAKTVKQQLADYGIEGRLTMILPQEAHLPFYPEKATRLLKGALDKVAELGGNFLGGVLHSAIGVFTREPRTEAEWDLLKTVFADVASYAKDREITLALEPINRYESYVLTSAAEVVTLAQELGMDNLGLMLDTFHMNIEENSFFTSVTKANHHLKYLHMTESDRGMLGEGNVHWDDLFKGLAEIKYSGPLVLENFSSHLTELIGPTSLWRPSPYDPETLAVGSLNFMKQKAAQWGLI